MLGIILFDNRLSVALLLAEYDVNGEDDLIFYLLYLEIKYLLIIFYKFGAISCLDLIIIKRYQRRGSRIKMIVEVSPITGISKKGTKL